MGLETYVYCDCYEKGRVVIPPPFPDLMFIDENGAPSVDISVEPDVQTAHDKWLNNPDVCKHGALTLAEHRLGNVGTISLVRRAVMIVGALSETDYPILLDKVLYDGTHTGDRLTPVDVQALQRELELLTECTAKERPVNQQGYLIPFIKQMNELVTAALSVNKPIVF